MRLSCWLALLLAIPITTTRAWVADHSPETTATWWADLGKDEPIASRALLKLAARPDAAMTLLKDKLKPLKIEGERVQFLLVMLGDEDEAIWRPAFEELDYFDPRLAIDLRTLMATTNLTPARQRLVELLSGREAGSLGRGAIAFDWAEDERSMPAFRRQDGSFFTEGHVKQINRTKWSTNKMQWSRASRAIILLESFGTPEAVALIKQMATGHPDAQPTRVAKETLERIAGSKP